MILPKTLSAPASSNLGKNIIATFLRGNISPETTVNIGKSKFNTTRLTTFAKSTPTKNSVSENLALLLISKSTKHNNLVASSGRSNLQRVCFGNVCFIGNSFPQQREGTLSNFPQEQQLLSVNSRSIFNIQQAAGFRTLTSPLHGFRSSKRFVKKSDETLSPTAGSTVNSNSYRTGPRISSGYHLNNGTSGGTNSEQHSGPNSTRTSPDKQQLLNRLHNNKRNFSSSNSHQSNKTSSSQRSFGTKPNPKTAEEEEHNNDIEFDQTTTKGMAPNNNSPVTQDDGSAIISGHKIALNVHYQQGQNGVHKKNLEREISTDSGTMVDERPALRELDEVIASAQRSSSNGVVCPETPEHFVDAAETLHDLEGGIDALDGHPKSPPAVSTAAEMVIHPAAESERITHVDKLHEAPSRDSGVAVSTPDSGSNSSLGDLKNQVSSQPSANGVFSDPLSSNGDLSSSPHSGSTASVDGQILTAPEEEVSAAVVQPAVVSQPDEMTQNEFLNGPDQIIPASSFKTWTPNGAVQMHITKEGVSSSTPLSVPTLLKKTASQYPNQNALMEKVGNEWVGTTYAEYLQQVRTVAKAFIKLGLDPYHGVCILGFNSKEWFISDLAAIHAGGFAAGIYTTNSAEACQHCALNCQAQIWVVEDQKQLDKVLKIRGNIPSLKRIIQYTGKPTVDGVLSWDEVMEIGSKESDEELENRLKRIAVNQCCTLIYTSGTTGPPKGVMLSHDNITWTALSISLYLKLNPAKEVVISYLPLSHVAAQLADIYMTIINGGTAYFAQPDALKGSLGVTLKEVRPTAFLGVPRVWEKIYEKMMDVGRKTKGVKKSIATWAKGLGIETNERKQKSDFSKPFGYSVANAVVFKKVKQVLGLDRCRVFLSGAAPIAPEIVRYFHSLDITLMEIYGMSESSGPHTTGIETAFKVGSAGRTIPGAATKVDKPDGEGNGEVCMIGRNVAMGYLLKEETTNDTVDDEGWLHSGDIGKIDDLGFLFITGRLKELIITAGGENIPPVLIEDELKAELSCISNAMLIGDKRKFLSILLTLKTNMNLDTGEALDTLTPACIEWCESIGSNAKTIYDVLSGPDAKIMRAIQDGIDRTNKKAASNAQRIQKWTILPRDFTVLGDELGPTMKLKRPVVSKKYAETIERFYAS